MVSEELPPLNKNEVLIKVKAIGLNFADIFTIAGLYKAAPKKDFIPGLEFSGIIIDKGKEVKEFEINDKIMGVIRFGAFTDHIVIDKNYVIKLPEDWSFEEGAGFIVQALTAYYALIKMGNLQSGHTVLIHSAAGGVGLYANRIAKKFSAFTIGTIGNANKLNVVENENYDEIIIRNKNFKEELEKKLNGRSLDLIMEAIGGKIQKISFNFLAPTGRMVAYGLSDYSSPTSRPNYLRLAYKYLTRPTYDTLTLIESNKSILGFNLIWLYDRLELLKGMLNEITELNLEKPIIGKVFEFKDLIKAVKELQSGKTIGKVVVKVE